MLSFILPLLIIPLPPAVMDLPSKCRCFMPLSVDRNSQGASEAQWKRPASSTFWKCSVRWSSIYLLPSTCDKGQKWFYHNFVHIYTFLICFSLCVCMCVYVSLTTFKFTERYSISALLTMPKPLTVWITINCGKF